MTCNRRVSGSAALPTNRTTLLLLIPPRRSLIRQRLKIGVGMCNNRRKSTVSCGDGGVAFGHTGICSRNSIWTGDVVDAKRADNEQPRLCAISTTPCPAALSRCCSIATARSSAMASIKYASHEVGANSDNPHPGKSMPKHGPTLVRRVKRGWNWASDPPRP